MASRTAYNTWTPQEPTLFDGHYLRNRSTLDIGVLGYIGIIQHKEHSPEVLSIPPGTPCIRIIKWVGKELILLENPLFINTTFVLFVFIKYAILCSLDLPCYVC